MSDNQKSAQGLDAVELGEDLKVRICSLVDSIVGQDPESYEADFVHFLTRAQDLVERKRGMEGTKHDTRDLIAELLFTRIRRGMRAFLESEDAKDEIKVAEWVMGSLFSIATLSDFSQAFDRAIIERGSDRDFSFAGRSDFISMEEVLQMLAAGKHRGCLSLEKGDNRLDIYISTGRVAFLDPHHMIRRVLPSRDPMKHREIPLEEADEAEKTRAQTGQPIFLVLREKGFFKDSELRDVMRRLGQEVLFDFMRDESVCAFFYRQQDELPEFVTTHDLRMGVTSMLLEGSKRLDDWLSMKNLFPDPGQAIEPKSDMYERMSDVNLDVLEIKLLTSINGDASPRSLSQSLGLPLHDIYQLLVKLAREGIIVAPGGVEALVNVSMSVEESIQMAFECLDANDDKAVMESALDKVLGVEDPGEAEDGEDVEDVENGEDGDIGAEFIKALRERRS